ncbi:SRPBCC domain-containing protein [Streptomyces sennicomposti]|uniref:SRPBCC domain-containing protein n=1 Tax=Streptomyces sennicomposti TaxID=2873384 RepID=UPI001CA71C1E|nr:SRPBCC domain-containing protein [Streptomyces sennicomposti]MBY8868423.1 serine/arginine repetitive matrix protein 1 [Streptomyces sennicomposti]
MEHEVFVPVPVPRLRAVLADPDRVARAVPGFQQDAGAEPVAGRLKLRIGGTSITYRGALRVQARDDGSYAVEGEAAESRGTGSVKLALTLRPGEADGGTALTVEGAASGDGRIAELDPEAVRTAAVRLLERFAENLAAEPGDAAEPGAGADAAPEPETAEELATEDFAPLATGDFEAAPDADDAPVPPPARPADQAAPADQASAEPSPHPAAEDSPARPAADGSAADGAAAEPGSGSDGSPAGPASADSPASAERPADPAAPADSPASAEHSADPAAPSGRASVFDTEIPPSSLDPSADDESDEYDEYGTYDADEQADDADAGTDGVAGVTGPGGFGETTGPPVEAAHARRTMIGRSAEEVDHAPPRGRYAPVPAPLTVSAGSALRWAAPAAALAVAGAIVVGRALRRRR